VRYTPGSKGGEEGWGVGKHDRLCHDPWPCILEEALENNSDLDRLT
jgi:hypothetical protein